MIKTNVHDGRRYGASTVRAVKITDSWNSAVLDTQQVASKPGPEAAGVRTEWQPIVLLNTTITQTAAALFRPYSG